MTLMRRIKMTSGYYDVFLSVYGDRFIENIMSKGILNNILLFLPLGMILYRLSPKMGIVFVPILFSILIESVQYFSKMGMFELSDIISNGLGGFLGFAIGKRLTKRFARIKNR